MPPGRRCRRAGPRISGRTRGASWPLRVRCVAYQPEAERGRPGKVQLLQKDKTTDTSPSVATPGATLNAFRNKAAGSPALPFCNDNKKAGRGAGKPRQEHASNSPCLKDGDRAAAWGMYFLPRAEEGDFGRLCWNGGGRTPHYAVQHAARAGVRNCWRTCQDAWIRPKQRSCAS